MNSKNSSGFTLIEVMLALVIAASILTSIYIMQSGALVGATRFAYRFARIIQAKDFMFFARRKREEAKDQKQFHLEKKEDDPETYLKYEFLNSEKSSLKNMKNIYLEKVSIRHEGTQKEANDVLLTLIYIPEEPE